MKRTLIFCIVILSIDLYSQNNRTEFSGYFGGSLFGLRSNSEMTLNFKYGASYTSGISFRHSIGYRPLMEYSLLYSNNDLLHNESITQYNSVDIPVRIKIYEGPEKLFFYSFGIFTSFITNVSVKSYSTEGELLDYYSVYDNFYKINFGISGSLGMRIVKLKNLSITIEISDNLGLRTITKEYNGPQMPYFKFKSNSLSLLIGITYSF